MSRLSARVHAFYNGLFRPKPRTLALRDYLEVEAGLKEHGLTGETDRLQLARAIAEDVKAAFKPDLSIPSVEEIAALVHQLFEFEGLFKLPSFDWSLSHSITEYWELQDELKQLKTHLKDFDGTLRLILLTLCRCIDPVFSSIPRRQPDTSDPSAITVPTELIHMIPDVGAAVEEVTVSFFDEDLVKGELFTRHRKLLDANLVTASGGNPADPKSFNKALRYPKQSDIKSPTELVQAYLRGSPAAGLFNGTINFSIPAAARFEHHHILAGSGHGKSQTLQYLISQDLQAVARGEMSVIVIDSQGDLIRRVSHLKQFAPGEALHDRIVLIDPADVEWPVSLNLFDVGLQRLEHYSKLDRERLTNSILELYDFVLGTLLSAEMTQKQNVIFRYVTRLMLHIPDATIHTLRELMEPKSEVKFAAHIETLTGSAKEFFRTEFGSSEFTQTRKQVLRRLWGILENQTFERMFSHPRSKLDLFSEMNAGKVILINTAKDLLKEGGTEIFGRFFIALIAQAAQERATLKERNRMPTIVYIDEAADYFDRNVGIILSQARKYNVGMVLAHQYLGQLDPKLQEAFAANTSIKFAGGVSAKDARAMAPMMSAAPELIETQPKGSFAAHVRGVTKTAIPLKFPLGYMESMPQMDRAEFAALRDAMREKYAVPVSEFDKSPKPEAQPPGGQPPPQSKKPKSDNDRTGPVDDDSAKSGW